MTRPAWVDVAASADLADIAAAFTLESLRHGPKIALDLLAAAAATRVARTWHERGIYDTDTAIAWCEAGRAYLRSVIGPEPADTSHEANTPEGNSR
jgi:hypothetical protein